MSEKDDFDSELYQYRCGFLLSLQRPVCEIDVVRFLRDTMGVMPILADVELGERVRIWEQWRLELIRGSA